MDWLSFLNFFSIIFSFFHWVCMISPLDIIFHYYSDTNLTQRCTVELLDLMKITGPFVTAFMVLVVALLSPWLSQIYWRKRYQKERIEGIEKLKINYLGQLPVILHKSFQYKVHRLMNTNRLFLYIELAKKGEKVSIEQINEVKENITISSKNEESSIIEAMGVFLMARPYFSEGALNKVTECFEEIKTFDRTAGFAQKYSDLMKSLDLEMRNDGFSADDFSNKINLFMSEFIQKVNYFDKLSDLSRKMFSEINVR